MHKAKNWFKGLSRTGQIAVTSVAVLIGLGTAGSLAQPGGQQAGEANKDASSVEVKSEPSPPATITKTEEVSEEVPFTSSTIESSVLAKGATETQTVGQNGVRTKTYRLTLIDGEETARQLISEVITTPAVNEVIAIGTYIKPTPPKSASCDPNYSGCVPIASDVDCAGGSGNGPAYVAGPVYVTGSDIYGLDRDGNGVGCE